MKQQYDLALLYNPQRKKGISENWEGSYEVVKTINELLYRLKRSSRGKSLHKRCLGRIRE